jgi:DNA-binding sugar fermentation-stimulating protein
LTESITLALIKRGALNSRLAESPVDIEAVETQRSMKRLSSESSSGSFRPDYRLNHMDGSVTILEVKQVVDTDYDPRHVAAMYKKVKRNLKPFIMWGVALSLYTYYTHS